jgi:DNA polymerase III subunit delta'
VTVTTTDSSAGPGTSGGVDPYGRVVGQYAARAFLATQGPSPLGAYLFVGPPGSGKLDLALAFAADIVSQGLDPEARRRAVDLVLARNHADVPVLVAEGARIRKEEAEWFAEEAHRTPVEGHTKVLIGVAFDAINEKAAAMLLKTIEEPEPAIVIVLLVDEVPPDLVTIASRCVRVELPPLTEADLLDALRTDPVLAHLPPERLSTAAGGAMGDLRRARVLALDERFALRLEAWSAVPSRLGGSGAAVAATVADLVAMVDEAVAPLKELLARETAEADEEAEKFGRRRESKKVETDRHKRIIRRFTNAEYLAGLGVLARRYGEAVVDGRLAPATGGAAVTAIDRLGGEWVRNPNAKLQLQALFLRLPPLPPLPSSG